MKLETKHLAPYLFYNLRMFHKGIFEKTKEAGTDYHPTRLIRLTTDGLFWVGKESDSRKLGEDIHIPILRPLSDLYSKKMAIELYKEIHGSRDEIWVETGKSKKSVIVGWANDNGFRTTAAGNWSIVDKHGNLLRHEYAVYEWLFKNHFDVYNLIPKGLAININTLDNA